MLYLKVPPPRKFSRPTGGARSAVIHLEPLARYRSQSIAYSASSTKEDDQMNEGSVRNQSRSAASSPDPLDPNIPRQYGQKYRKPVFGKGAEKECRSSTRPSRRTIYPQSVLRGFSIIRGEQLVRFIYIDNLAHEITTLYRLDTCQEINESPFGHQK